MEREWLWKRYETLVSESLTAEQKKGLSEEMLRYANYLKKMTKIQKTK